ncbi:Protein of unknown function [Gryllus bimaculatus]|nr:Protein of unknown function [Gryllus bimaculatus]
MGLHPPTPPFVPHYHHRSTTHAPPRPKASPSAAAAAAALLAAEGGSAPLQLAALGDAGPEREIEGQYEDKRAWKNLGSAWGKRGDWASFRGIHIPILPLAAAEAEEAEAVEVVEAVEARSERASAWRLLQGRGASETLAGTT